MVDRVRQGSSARQGVSLAGLTPARRTPPLDPPSDLVGASADDCDKIDTIARDTELLAIPCKGVRWKPSFAAVWVAVRYPSAIEVRAPYWLCARGDRTRRST